MVERLIRFACALPKAHLYAGVATVALFSILVAIQLVRSPWVALQAARGEQIGMAQAGQSMESMRQAIQELERELALQSEGRPLQSDQVVVEVLGTLNHLSTEHRVSLLRVSPGTARPVMTFEEIPFEVEVSGPYQEVVRWLQDVEVRLPVLAIHQFHLQPHDETRSVLLRARLNAYIENEGRK